MNATDELSVFRQELHRYPEIAGNEYGTAERLKKHFQQLHPDKIIEGIGGAGIAVVFSGKENGPSVLFRAELDALPMEEYSSLNHRSQHRDAAHKCGHDGHMTILAGLGNFLHEQPPVKGEIILLFQPAEETGQGAKSMLADTRWKELNPDYVFALHNLPGFPAGEIIMREGNFSSASVGFEVFLKGKTSHAAEPEKGNNPSEAVGDIIRDFHQKLVFPEYYEGFILATIVHVLVGEKAFGTSAGSAVFRATLRAAQQHDFELLKKNALAVAKMCAQKHQLDIETNWVEEFPVTANNAQANKFVLQAANKNALNVHHISEPFRWSEDFGWFLQKYPGALFGLGAGEKTAPLHHPEYDFNDAILPAGVSMFKEICFQLNY